MTAGRRWMPDGGGGRHERTAWSGVALTLALTLTAACGGGTGRFDGQNARAHVERLAGAIGSRPAGSTANQQARAYLIETLQLYGFDVRVQEAEAQWREGGLTATVANIIALRNGQSREAIGLVAHYDSVPDGPGAGDDAFGVAVALEAARVLAARTSPRHTLMVLLTDGEEDGMMGARALVDDVEVRGRLRTYVNLEAIGTRSPLPLFETGPGTGPALRAWAAAPHPRGGSYMQSIYEVLPNDTDATVLRGLGIFGLNFAATGDSHAYHTDRDRADRVSVTALSRLGDNVVAIVEGLDEGSLEGTPGTPVYFSLLERWGFVISTTTARVLGVLAIVLGVAAWGALARQTLRRHGGAAIVATFAWATLATGAAALALGGAVWLLRAARAELHPWHASSWRLFVFMTVMVVTVTWLVRRGAASLPPRLRPLGTPAAVWMTALPVWTAAAIATLVYAVSASYLVTVPLAFTAPLLLVGLVGSPVMRGASALSALPVWALWLPDVWGLLGFAVAVLGRLPVVTPTWLFPVVFMGVGVFIWPPVLAVLVGRLGWRMRHGLAAAVLMTATVIAAGLVLLAPAYTAEQPQRRTATFVDDRTTGQAFWRVSGNEPGVDIGAGLIDVQWQLTSAAQMRAPRTPVGAFVFEGQVAPPQDALPARAQALITRHADGADIEVRLAAHTRERLSATFVLPEAVVPVATSLPGRTVAGRWRATHVNVPREGLTWRATVPPSQADALDNVHLRVEMPGLPGGDSVTGLPPWLSNERTAWMARTVILTGLTPDALVAPVESALGTSTYAPTPVGRVHYLDRGEGDAALVFLHGWGGHAAHWEQQAPLASSRRALFIDLPGHGRSEPGPGPHTIASAAEAVHATLQSAGVSRAVVVGHSLGALVAWHVALQAPDRVEAIVSVDGTLVPFLPDAVAAARFTATIDAADMGPFIDRLQPGLFTAASPEALRTQVGATMRQTAATVLAQLMADVSVTGGPPFLPGTLTRPVLALECTGPAQPSTEARLRETFSSLDYRAFPNTGHYLMIERPREVNDAIAGFLIGRGLLR